MYFFHLGPLAEGSSGKPPGRGHLQMDHRDHQERFSFNHSFYFLSCLLLLLFFVFYLTFSLPLPVFSISSLLCLLSYLYPSRCVFPISVFRRFGFFCVVLLIAGSNTGRYRIQNILMHYRCEETAVRPARKVHFRFPMNTSLLDSNTFC